MARAGGIPAVPHPVSVLAPCAPSGAELARGQSLQRCDATQEPAARLHMAHPGHDYWADRPCLALSRVYRAVRTSQPNPHQADGRTDCTSVGPSPSGPAQGVEALLLIIRW